MAREIEQTELDQQIGRDLERVDWWVDTVKSLAEPIPAYDGQQGAFAPQENLKENRSEEQAGRAARPIKPASA